MLSQIAFVVLSALTAADMPSGVVAAKAKIEPKQAVADLTGYYVCKGSDGKKSYSGVVLIIKKEESYLVQWTVGTSTFMGVGMRQGDVFCEGWAISAQKGVAQGVNMYRIESGTTPEAGHRLVGRWVILGGAICAETLNFLKELEED